CALPILTSRWSPSTNSRRTPGSPTCCRRSSWARSAMCARRCVRSRTAPSGPATRRSRRPRRSTAAPRPAMIGSSRTGTRPRITPSRTTTVAEPHSTRRAYGHAQTGRTAGRRGPHLGITHDAARTAVELALVLRVHVAVAGARRVVHALPDDLVVVHLVHRLVRAGVGQALRRCGELPRGGGRCRVLERLRPDVRVHRRRGSGDADPGVVRSSGAQRRVAADAGGLPHDVLPPGGDDDG